MGIITFQKFMKENNNSFLIVILAYCMVIGLVLLWSGRNKEKTVFDKYLISFKGISLTCNELEESSQFFKEVLEFHENEQHPKQFDLPDKSTITLLKGDTQPDHKINIRLKVRNGIYNLHLKLATRIAEFSNLHKNKTSEITEIEKTSNYRYFSILDPSGHRISFYQSRVFSHAT